MPRLPTSLILQARKISSLLPLVLQGARTLDSAKNELRWMLEYLLDCPNPPKTPREERAQLSKLCKRRARSEPLQYILGSQPFGKLDIKCRPGVLIPRPETESITEALAKYIDRVILNQEVRSWQINEPPGENGTHKRAKFKVIDVCSGSGCITLALHSLLSKPAKSSYDLEITGLDISKKAIDLSNANLKHNISLGNLDASAMDEVTFVSHDFLKTPTFGDSLYHVIVSNPPYISPRHFDTETTRSVRNFEPRLALVPSQNEGRMTGWDPTDVFYAHLIRMYVAQRAVVLVMEVGDEEQAIRIIDAAIAQYAIHKYSQIKIWRDLPCETPTKYEHKRTWKFADNDFTVSASGEGNVRAVVIRRSARGGVLDPKVT